MLAKWPADLANLGCSTRTGSFCSMTLTSSKSVKSVAQVQTTLIFHTISTSEPQQYRFACMCAAAAAVVAGSISGLRGERSGGCTHCAAFRTAVLQGECTACLQFTMNCVCTLRVLSFTSYLEPAPPPVGMPAPQAPPSG